jgi:hypothetical protein
MSVQGIITLESFLNGEIPSKTSLIGNMSKLETIYSDAYKVAVENGFKGSVEEWLESLKGEKGYSPTIEVADIEGGHRVTITDIDGVKTFDVMDGVGGGGSVGSTARIGELVLFANGWVGNESPYSQVVSIEGVTENSQVDLTPSVEQLSVFYNKDIAFVTENEDGVVTVYAIGQKPQNDYTIQVTITEVNV